MRPVRLADLRDLVAQPEFQDWWRQLYAAQAALGQAQARWQQALRDAALSDYNAELVQKNAIDTLYRANESEDAAATLQSEAADAENAAFQLVSQYEDFRIHVSEVWYRLGALEKEVEERKEALAQPGAGKKLEEALRTATRAQDAARGEYERLSWRKREIWDRVEAAWAKQAEAALKMSEATMRGRRVRAQAEEGFQEAEKLRADIARAKADSERASNEVSALKTQIARLLKEASLRFGCASGEDFLYFRHRDHSNWSFCVALVADAENYNVEVKPLSIYSVEQIRGVTFLEPAQERATSSDEGDKRFEEYFLSGRKGRAPAVGT